MWSISSNGKNTDLEEKPIAIANIIGTDKAFPLCIYLPEKKLDIIFPAPPVEAGQIVIPRTEDNVFSIEIGQVKYVPSVNPEKPNPGEFVIKDDKIVVVVKGQPPEPGINLVIKTEPLTISTDYVNPSLFQAFLGLPVVGTISWTRSLEQHPSGSASLNALRSGINLIRSRFSKGSEIEFAGIGFSVSGYSDRLLNTHEYPGGLYEVSISFTGKWNRRKYNEPVFYKGRTTISGSSAPILKDPDCEIPSVKSTSPTSVSVASLGGQNRVPINYVGTNWDVAIPLDISSEATTSWLSEFQARTRVNGAIAFFSSPSAVKAIPALGGNFWLYDVPALEVSPNGDFEHNDGRFGYAAEYPKVKIDGKFSAPKEETIKEVSQQKSSLVNKPQWKRREPVILESVNGDNDIENPPANTNQIVSLDLNWDTSGPTKTQEKTKTEDGLTLSRTITTYGFMYNARDIYHEGGEEEEGYYREDAAPYWKMVKQETETFNYDGATGYLLGTTTVGWQYLRFQNENAQEPETVFVDTDDAEETRRLFMFEFKKYSINGETAYYLEQHLDYFKDIESPPQIEYKVCQLDGSSYIAYADDPSYVPPFFVSIEMTHRNTFASSPHPDNTNEDDDSDDPPARLPDLTLGEETLTRRVLKILPSAKSELKVNGFTFESSLTNIPDRYSEYSSNFSASGPGFKNCSEETKITTHDGRPPIATRKPAKDERIDPASSDPDPSKAPSQNLYEYYLLTPGYSLNSPSNGSVSYPNAKTLDAALLAAKTDLAVKDATESVSFSFGIPFNFNIQEFDKVLLKTAFDFYNVRVLSASNSVLIQGFQDMEALAIPLVTCPEGTKISAGIDRVIPVSISKVDLSSRTQPPRQKDRVVITQTITKDVKLGGILNESIPTRRNS